MRARHATAAEKNADGNHSREYDTKGDLKVLLVYPEYPETFWSLKHAIRFISKKAVHPPLGLITVAAMLPQTWKKRLVDMNVRHLKDRDIQWADVVFISGMAIQKESAAEVVRRCKQQGTKMVAGGPLFTESYEDESFRGIDHFVLNEAENTLAPFLEDFHNGTPRPLYTSAEFPEITGTPTPLWELLDMKNYADMSIQYSRGCPFDCEFCDITALFGRKVRCKTAVQMETELERLYSLGWRGPVFLADDNFIGNKQQLKKSVLPAVTAWMERRKNPFNLATEVSINIADDDTLMEMMVRAGFDTIFIGIETPDNDSLQECGKIQNKNRDMVAAVKKIRRFGLDVTGGFIVGFDHDTPSIFMRQIEFIEKSGIVTAMVGLLNAPRNTRLYRRLKSEKRLLDDFTGSNTDLSVNFVPKMGYNKLVEGYKQILSGLYSCKPYYKRVKQWLIEKENGPGKTKGSPIRPRHIKALFKTIVLLGIKDSGRLYYWKLFFWSLFRHPRLFSKALTFAVFGFHFRKVFSI